MFFNYIFSSKYAANKFYVGAVHGELKIMQSKILVHHTMYSRISPDVGGVHVLARDNFPKCSPTISHRKPIELSARNSSE